MANTVKIQAYLTPELFGKFETHRRSTEKSISSIISLALEEYLDRQQSPSDVPSEHPMLEYLTRLEDRFDQLKEWHRGTETLAHETSTAVQTHQTQISELKDQIEGMKSTMVQLWQAITVKIAPVPEQVLDGAPYSPSEEIHEDLVDIPDGDGEEELPIISYLSSNHHSGDSQKEDPLLPAPDKAQDDVSGGGDKDLLHTQPGEIIDDEETTDSVDTPILRLRSVYPATVINDWDSDRPINSLTNIYGLTSLLITDQQFQHRMEVKQSTLNTKKKHHPTQQAKWSQDKDCNNFFWVWHPAKKMWLGRSPDQMNSLDWSHPEF